MHVDKTETFTTPDKYRKIGNPNGKYILYIEDYAHTFIRQNLQMYKQKVSFFVYGQVYLTNNVYHVMVQGALDKDDVSSTYFPRDSYLGVITIATKKKEKVDSKWTLQCELSSEITCILEDFYIYYEKNEQMQNYLIQWHEGMEHKDNHIDQDIKMKYTRAIQEQCHNIKEKSYQKQIYTGVCLSFCLLFMVMLVTVLNSYQKMNMLQTDLVQLIEYIESGEGYQLVQTINSEIMNHEPAIEPEVLNAEEIVQDEEKTNDIIQEETGIYEEETSQQSEDNNTVEEPESQIEEKTQQESEVKETMSNNAKGESYIVQKGDTLQAIVYRKYGSLSNMDNICTINSLSNPDDIKEGEELYLP